MAEQANCRADVACAWVACLVFEQALAAQYQGTLGLKVVGRVRMLP
jgi:hypothetical protein